MKEIFTVKEVADYLRLSLKLSGGGAMRASCQRLRWEEGKSGQACPWRIQRSEVEKVLVQNLAE